MPTTADKAAALSALHIPGDPLIVVNVWDAMTARIVARTPGVKALATASHSIAFSLGVDDGEGMTVDMALGAAARITASTELPVSVDFERGYAADAAGVRENVARLIEAGAAGLNIEDSLAGATSERRPIDEAAARVAAARAAADAAGVPLAINARTDTLAGSPDNWEEAIDRANAYVDAGATSIFMLGLSTEEKVADAVAAVRAPIALFAHPGYIPLARLAELGVGRISFGPQILGLTLSHLASAAVQLTARGDYPSELGYRYEL
ncbi:isocitrate lyase/PEP mutase family protein [Microcella sp.]|uniref:isocitrate lyase/PEP mutase family protein n=1 Tax=Microcella sp. TaxID=1913979 RepID=UPI00256503DC|nr:isocitrate lyase/phosphoenolpyruvate mutase family protein [Microcella sp.]MBX9472181.1 isocitrate lyase/phosphoenolpyruvate mutase family protein [Microcella sp.]